MTGRHADAGMSREKFLYKIFVPEAIVIPFLICELSVFINLSSATVPSSLIKI
jgi:hypothetical protein